MNKNLGLTLVTSLIALQGTAHAQDAMFRYDAQGSVKGYTIGLEDKNGVGVYAFYYNTKFPEYDLGQIKQIWAGKHAFLLGGGYLAYWPGSNQGNAWFAQPWLIGGASVGKVDFHLGLGAYAPLNGGPTILFSNDASALYSATPTLRAGVGATYWNQTGSPAVLRYGPKVRLKLGSGYDLSMAAYIWGHHESNYRVVLTKSF